MMLLVISIALEAAVAIDRGARGKSKAGPIFTASL